MPQPISDCSWFLNQPWNGYSALSIFIFHSIMLIKTLILTTVYASTLCWHKPPRPSWAFGTGYLLSVPSQFQI